MAITQATIQHRRGPFDEFDKTKMLPAEFAVVLSGDPDVPSGKALYLAFASGDVHRIVSIEDLEEMVRQDVFKGDKGDPGKDGANITGARIEKDGEQAGHLIFTLSDGTEKDAGLIDDALARIDEAVQAAESAALSEQKAAASEKSAADSAEAAAGSADAASASESAAEKSAGAAKDSKDAAAVSEQNSAASEQRAKGYADSAGQSASAAADSEQAAGASASQAASSAQSADSSATSANESKEAAAESASAAKDSENAAAKSASDAEQSKSSAALSEQNAADSETAAGESAAEAKASETAANESKESSAQSAQNAAESEANAADSETAAKASADASAASERNAGASETAAAGSADAAKDWSLWSQSYAVGTGGKREGEETDNAKFYYEQTLHLSQGTNGIVPMGTVSFADLAGLPKEVGHMYNVRDAFVSDDTFNDGGGVNYGPGNNVIWTAEELWDVTAASGVTGVKGEAEESFRQGNVTITKRDLGIDKVVNTKQLTHTLSAEKWTGDEFPYLYEVPVEGLSETQCVEAYNAMKLSEEELQAFMDAGITAHHQEAGKIVLQALNIPEMDLPIIIEIGGEPE